MNDRQFREHLAELLNRQRNPDQPANKNPPTPEPTPEHATKSNKEFRQHIKRLLARQSNQDQQTAVPKRKPPKSEPLKPSAVLEKNPAAVTSKTPAVA